MAAPRPLLEDEGQPSAGSPVQIGQVVSGKYRIERQIGRGGMGIVLAATHLQLEHLVAIKVMRRDLGLDDKSLDRLLMEARSAARIRSEHVARVLDVGTLENGSPFIVMEYLEGENLADLLDREGALEIEQAASFLMQCCLALAEVHVAEMVHRDLKPGNLFIARLPDGSPTVKIVDFGISKQIGSARDLAATTSPQVLGSPFYMSPEQMRADAVDERSDIWGLGAILFEMLTGRPPFIGDTLPEVYAAVLNDPPPAVDGLRSGVPGGLDDVVQRCLEKDPAQRFCDVADLSEALAPYAGPNAAQSVERITRILTNPEAVRARYSLLPASGASGAAISGGGQGSGERQVSGGAPGELASGMLGAEREGMMGADSEDERARREQRPSRLDVADTPAAGTWLEPGNPGAGDARRSWRPSRPALSGEFAPLAASGIQGGRRRGALWAKLAAAAGALSLVGALGMFWLRGNASEDVPPPRAARVEVVNLTPTEQPSQPPPAPAEPRVTPLAPEPTGSSAQPEAPSASSALSLPPGKPTPLRASSAPAPQRRPVAGESERSERLTPAAPGAAPESASTEPAPVRAPERAAVAHGEDPWDPHSFGDRR